MKHENEREHEREHEHEANVNLNGHPRLPYYSLLVAAMHLLLSDKISHSMLRKAEQYLDRFYKMFATLYGK